MWQGGCVLFLSFKMSQNSFDDVLIFDASDNRYRPTAAGADHDVYIEYALEPLSPGHCCMSLRCRADLSIGNRLGTFSSPGWRDQPTPAVIWRQNTVIAGEVDAGFGYQGSRILSPCNGSVLMSCASTMPQGQTTPKCDQLAEEIP